MEGSGVVRVRIPYPHMREGLLTETLVVPDGREGAGEGRQQAVGFRRFAMAVATAVSRDR